MPRKGRRWRTVIEGNAASSNGFTIHDPEETDEPTGTTVTLTLHDDAPLGGLLRDDAADELAFRLALYLEKYPQVRVGYNGDRVDPGAAKSRDDTYPLDPDETQSEHPAELTVVEWSRKMGRALVLCNAGGFALSEQQPGIHAPGYHFTAYVKSEEFSEIGADVLDAGAGMHPRVQPILDAAKSRLKTHFSERAREDAKSRVQEWKREKVYPYKGDPKGTLDEAERKVFDMVALTVSDHLASFDQSDTRTKRLSLRLIREALERNPGSLHLILGEVLELPKTAQDDLAGLLQRTSLTSVIKAARTIADRLDFLTMLERLVFDEETKGETLERAHLHELVAEETWIFGEQYALSASDRSLTEVLRKHLDADDKELLGAPVLRGDGRAGRVDLMLSRRIPHPRPEQREHLVVELKRPKVVVGMKEVDQIKSYARAVVADSRFATVDATWTFWLVTAEFDDEARHESEQKGRAAGILHITDTVTVWLRTCASLINDARSRLELFQKELAYASDDDSAVEYVRQRHRDAVPTIVLPDTTADDGTEDGSVEGAEPAGSPTSPADGGRAQQA
ncbi:hypothetical protein BH23ACT8_BH23ACT8_03120 [soil metagenome]